MIPDPFPFWKMHGTGNDFVLAEADSDAAPDATWAALALRICDRHFGVGADGLILVMESGHKKAIEAGDITARGKVARIGEWQDKDINDPYRQPRAAFEAALADIEAGVAAWVERLQGEGQ